MFERENNEVNNAITILQNIDLDTIASIFRFAVIYYASRKVTQGVALQIEYHFPKCKKIKMPPELVLESGDFQVDDKIKEEDKAHILNFINTVCSNFSDDCLILLCNNLKSYNHHEENRVMLRCRSVCSDPDGMGRAGEAADEGKSENRVLL